MRPSLVVAGILCLSSPLHAQVRRELTPEIKARLFAPTAKIALATKIVRVPMRGTDRAGNRKCPYFQVFVNGKGPFTFVYDLGASYTLVSSKVTDAAGTHMIFDRGGHRDVVQFNGLSLGGVDLRDVQAIRDDEFVGGVGVDGVLGFPALGNANVLFDFSRREILVSREPIPMGPGFSLPYEAPANVPTVPVGIGKRTVPILLDTGDDAFALEIRTIELGDTAIQHAPKAVGTVMNGATAQQTAITTLRDPVTLGPMHAPNAEIGINDDLPVGDLGYDALKLFRFQIEPKTSTVRFQPLFRGKQFKLTNIP